MPSEATVLLKLRAAGAIILGKATMGEWSQCRSRKKSSSHGWSAYGGQPVGVFHSEQDPHGSSSGSAVAVSAGLAPFALGTETSGSIVNPCERNGLIGIKVRTVSHHQRRTRPVPNEDCHYTIAKQYTAHPRPY